MRLRGTPVKHINNLIIKRLKQGSHIVVSPLPNEKILKDNMTLEEAELYCSNNKDYIIK
jgi:hypothetical protein